MTCLGEGVPFVAHYATYWPRRWHRQLIEGQFAIGVAGEQVTLFKGDDTKGQKLSGPRHEAALHQARVAWAGPLCSLIQDKYTLSNIPAVDIEDKPTIGIKAVYDSGSEVMLYFDKSTFLLTMLEAKVTAQEIGGKLVKCGAIRHDILEFSARVLTPHRPQRTQFHPID